MLSEHDTDSYVPKDASEESANVSNILSSIRSKLEEPIKVAEKEVKEIANIVSNSSHKDKLVKQLQASIPKTLKSGSVGEGIYACIATTVDGVPSVCTPACQSGASAVSAGNCSKQVFLKKEDEELQKVNKTNSTEAYVYISGNQSKSSSSTVRSRTSTTGSSSSSVSLSKEDISKLQDSGVKSVEVFVANGPNSYRKSHSLSLREKDSTHYSKNSRCAITEESCEEEHNYKWLLLIGVVVFLIVAAFFFWRWYTHAAVSTTTTVTQKREMMRAPYVFE